MQPLLSIIGLCTRLTPEQILGPSRIPQIVDARTILIYHLRRQGHTLTQIAKLLRRTHSTILYHLRRHDNLITTDPAYRTLADDVALLLAHSTTYSET